MEEKEKGIHLESEIYRGNLIIQKLEARIGALSGKITELETDNEILRNYINKLQNEESDKEGESDKEDE